MRTDRRAIVAFLVGLKIGAAAVGLVVLAMRQRADDRLARAIDAAEYWERQAGTDPGCRSEIEEARRNGDRCAILAERCDR